MNLFIIVFFLRNKKQEIKMDKFPTHNSIFNNLINFEYLDFKNNYDVNSTHRHSYFELIFFSEGGGEQIIDFEKRLIKANQVSLILPGQIHSLKRSEKTRGIVFQFKQEAFSGSKEIFRQLMNISRNFTSVILTENYFLSLYNLIEFLKTRFDSGLTNSQLTHINYIKLILSEFEDCIELKSGSENDDLAADFFDVLEKEFCEQKSVSFYSAKLNVSSRTLNSVLEKHTGKKILKHIHERVLLEIKRLLMNKNLNLKEITYQLNFDSPATFSRFVKSQTGKLPSELKSEVSKIHN